MAKKLHSRSFELDLWSKCHPEFKCSWFRSTNGGKLKLTIDVDDLSDGLLIAALSSELYVEDHAVDTPKMDFSANKILAGRFFDNLSNDILDHHGKFPFV